jgi:hypothetical protein
MLKGKKKRRDIFFFSLQLQGKYRKQGGQVGLWQISAIF